ncbi:MAG: threonine/serine dehydratase [Pseudomonadota bacterium]
MSVAPTTVTYNDIISAAARLSGVVNTTPLLSFADLDRRAGGTVYLKAENLQRMGSFKIRGAYNAIAQLTPEQRASGVVAWSSGNHAQGVALAAHLFGCKAHIVMPEDAPAGKRAAVLRLGARIVDYDRYSEDREAIALALAERLGAPLIPSYDHLSVIAGQGTVGLEVFNDPCLQAEPPDQVLVCCGGGGLVAGIGLAAQALTPTTRIFAVEPAVADDTKRSLASGTWESNPADTVSICDALLTPTPGKLTFGINQQRLAGVLTVTDDEVRFAIGYARRELRLVVEPGGAVALAAVLAGKVNVAGLKTVVILSGGNIDDAMLADATDYYHARSE